MRPLLESDFSTLMGKLGNWPGLATPSTQGDFTVQAAEAALRLGSQLPRGSTFVDVGASYGHSTVVLSAAALRVGGKVIAVDKWQDPSFAQATLWFNRALKLFNAAAIVHPAEGVTEQADFVLAREHADSRSLYAEGLKLGGVMMILGNEPKLEGLDPFESGVGYAAWRKEKPQEAQHRRLVPRSIVEDAEISTETKG